MKKKYSKKITVCLLLFSFILPLLTGCGEAATGQTELWIVTEQTTWDRMNGQAEVLIEDFEETNPGVTVNLDILPLDEQERSVYLQQLRTQILQGGGPDGYLLPTDNIRILDEPAQYTYVEAEPLFIDVELAMRNGLFYDISRFYDADDTLGKDGLNTSIMNAGVIDGARYVLPLRYDIPVIYAEPEALQAAGLDSAILEEDIQTIMEAVLATEDPLLACGILQDSFSAFSDLIDYASGNAVLEEKVLIRYMQTYQQLQTLLGNNFWDNARSLSYEQFYSMITDDTVLMEKLSLSSYIYCNYGEPIPVAAPDNVIIIGQEDLIEEEMPQIRTEYYPLYIGSIVDALEYGAVARYKGVKTIMTPMRAVGGDVVATVTYYAAVGSGSKDPALTYEFLRQFLLEESQWEENRPERKHTEPIKGTASNSSNDLQYPGFIGNGWPVRSAGSLKDMWQVRRKQVYVSGIARWEADEVRRRMRLIGRGELEDEWIPILNVQVDQVRFNTTLSEEFEDALATLNDRAQGNAATQVDMEETAQQLLWNLRWHISEG